MIQEGEYKAEPPELKNVVQSASEAGAKSLVPEGQLFAWLAFDTEVQPSHLRIAPAEYVPESVNAVHEQPLGLPLAGVKE
jgi:hypothetical protein